MAHAEGHEPLWTQFRFRAHPPTTPWRSPLRFISFYSDTVQATCTRRDERRRSVNLRSSSFEIWTNN